MWFTEFFLGEGEGGFGWEGIEFKYRCESRELGFAAFHAEGKATFFMLDIQEEKRDADLEVFMSCIMRFHDGVLRICVCYDMIF